jgi:hypothetical protein
MQAEWTSDWIWSLPLILFTMILHVLVLGLVFRLIVGAHDRATAKGHGTVIPASIFVMAFILSAIVLHALEVACWGWTFLLLGALPDVRDAMLYSLNAMTTFGHIAFDLANPWRLMGALEALNGILLFGLSTAFMFALLVRLNFADDRRRT